MLFKPNKILHSVFLFIQDNFQAVSHFILFLF